MASCLECPRHKKILQAAEEHTVKVAVGLQGRWAPPVAKVKEILDKGGVGKVLSSEVHIFGGSAFCT